MTVVRKIVTIAMALSVAWGATGCAPTNSTAQPAESEAVEENPYGGFPVDLPAADEIVLSVSNGTDTVDYSMAELIELSTTEITILEPFVEKKQTFSGVPLSYLFEQSGLTASDSVATIALNDYQYVDSVDAFTANNGLLAVLRDGEQIPMDAGGPIRIVFPAETEYFALLDAWNWSLRSIERVE